MSDLEALIEDAVDNALDAAHPISHYECCFSRAGYAHAIVSAVFPVVERFVSSLPQDPEDSTTNENLARERQWQSRLSATEDGFRALADDFERREFPDAASRIRALLETP